MEPAALALIALFGLGMVGMLVLVVWLITRGSRVGKRTEDQLRARGFEPFDSFRMRGYLDELQCEYRRETGNAHFSVRLRNPKHPGSFDSISIQRQVVFDVKQHGADAVFQPLRVANGGRYKLRKKSPRVIDFPDDEETDQH